MERRYFTFILSLLTYRIIPYTIQAVISGESQLRLGRVTKLIKWSIVCEINVVVLSCFCWVFFPFAVGPLTCAHHTAVFRPI